LAFYKFTSSEEIIESKELVIKDLIIAYVTPSAIEKQAIRR